MTVFRSDDSAKSDRKLVKSGSWHAIRLARVRRYYVYLVLPANEVLDPVPGNNASCVYYE
jgi:hypothetical protein